MDAGEIKLRQGEGAEGKEIRVSPARGWRGQKVYPEIYKEKGKGKGSYIKSCEISRAGKKGVILTMPKYDEF